MVLTPSIMIPLGTPVPDFTLPDVVSGKKISPADFKTKKALLVMYLCRHCPYVQHIKFELARLGKDTAKKDLAIVAISSNDAGEYPDDKPENLKAMAKELGFIFPFCYDESQEVAKKYSAACTPDFFLFGRAKNDSPLLLVYRGQLDDSRPGNGKPVTGRDLRAAIEATLAGKSIPASAQRPSIGCNIKWRAGNEPAYFPPKG